MKAPTDKYLDRLLRRETGWFLAICFIATYGLNAAVFFLAGPYADGSDAWRLALTFSMLIPASSAILCLLLFRRAAIGTPVRIFFALFLATLVLPILLKTFVAGPLFEIVQTVLVLGGTMVIIILNLRQSWRAQLRPFGLALERGIGFFAVFLLLYALMLAASFALNPLFGLSRVNAEMPFTALVAQALLSLVMVIAGGWFVYFGEEYGWRYYLQHRLVALYGSARGVLLLGLIWGLWHAPVIAMGYNYPGRPLLGVLAMTLFTVVIGIYFSFAVMRAGSVWPAVILHGLNNSIAPLLVAYFGDVSDRVFAFGIGLYGIALFALPALWLLSRMRSGKVSQPAEFSLE